MRWRTKWRIVLIPHHHLVSPNAQCDQSSCLVVSTRTSSRIAQPPSGAAHRNAMICANISKTASRHIVVLAAVKSEEWSLELPYINFPIKTKNICTFFNSFDSFIGIFQINMRQLCKSKKNKATFIIVIPITLTITFIWKLLKCNYLYNIKDQL